MCEQLNGPVLKSLKLMSYRPKTEKKLTGPAQAKILHFVSVWDGLGSKSQFLSQPEQGPANIFFFYFDPGCDYSHATRTDFHIQVLNLRSTIIYKTKIMSI